MNDTRLPLVECKRVVKAYREGGAFASMGGGSTFLAVDRVDLTVYPGESLALVGESGSGKSTTGRLLLGLEPCSSGQVRFKGQDLAGLTPLEMRRLRSRMQMVFQDPLGSLNPRFTVKRTLAEPLRIHCGLSGPALERRVAELLELVGLAPEHAGRYPHEFSGGQRQRVAIARAISVEPAFIVADEPVSALDISIQGQILRLMQQLRRRLGLALLFISHDLAVVRAVCDRVAVMYQGRIVELAGTVELFDRPLHCYTRLLLEAAGFGGRERKDFALAGGQDRRVIIPDLMERFPGHFVAADD